MASAAHVRFRAAIEEFIQSTGGDTGTRRAGGVRSQLNDRDAKLIESARGMLTEMGDGDTTGGARSTPGSRARDRAAGGTPSTLSTTDRARAMIGAAPVPTPEGGQQ